MNNQYTQRQVPALLKSLVNETSLRQLGTFVEFTVNGERITVPTAEAFMRLTKQLAAMEQKLLNIDNKAGKAMRKAYEI
jgi:hypothetical protein